MADPIIDTEPTMEDAVFAIAMADPLSVQYLADRLYPIDFPQAPVYPAATYQVITRFQYNHLSGASNLARSRIQFDVYAYSYDEVVRICRALVRAMNAYKGLVPVEGGPPVEVQGIFCTMEEDRAETVIRQSGRKVRRRQLEFTVWCK